MFLQYLRRTFWQQYFYSSGYSFHTARVQLIQLPNISIFNIAGSISYNDSFPTFRISGGCLYTKSSKKY